MADTPRTITIDLDVKSNVLSAEQLARVAALRVAREVLVGAPGVSGFVKTTVPGPSDASLVYIAEWIEKGGDDE